MDAVVNCFLRPEEIHKTHKYEKVRLIIALINEQLRMGSYAMAECDIGDAGPSRLYQLSIDHSALHDLGDDVMDEIRRALKKSGWTGMSMAHKSHEFGLENLAIQPFGSGLFMIPNSSQTSLSKTLITLSCPKI